MPTLLESIGTRFARSRLAQLGKLFRRKHILNVRKVIYCGKEYFVKSACLTRDGIELEFHDAQAASIICEANGLTKDGVFWESLDLGKTWSEVINADLA